MVENSHEYRWAKFEENWPRHSLAEIFLDTYWCPYTSQNTHSKISFLKLNAMKNNKLIAGGELHKKIAKRDKIKVLMGKSLNGQKCKTILWQRTH